MTAPQQPYPQGYGPPYAPQPPVPSNGLGVAALVLGILAILLAFIPILGFVAYPLAIVGIILGLVGLGRVRRGRSSRGITLAGLIASIVGLVLVIVSTVIYVSALSAGVASADKAVNGLHNVTYKVTSTSGGKIVVGYSQGTGGSGSGSAVSVPSPWTIDATVTGSSAFVTASSSIDIQNPNATEGLTCEIIDKDTGKSVVKNSVPPSQGASVTCSTFSLGN